MNPTLDEKGVTNSWFSQLSDAQKHTGNKSEKPQTPVCQRKPTRNRLKSKYVTKTWNLVKLFPPTSTSSRFENGPFKKRSTCKRFWFLYIRSQRSPRQVQKRQELLESQFHGLNKTPKDCRATSEGARACVRRTVFCRFRLVGVDVLRFGLLAPRHGATIRGKEFQTIFLRFFNKFLWKLAPPQVEMRMSTQLLLSIMHCDLSRSPDSWLAPVQVLPHYSNAPPIDARCLAAGGGGRSPASGRRAGWRPAHPGLTHQPTSSSSLPASPHPVFEGGGRPLKDHHSK